ncbi:MAG: DUF192 domain-containing protein [Acidobacteria bacterium]|nr:DUF192 domain-containing protein [Acidobacteriota bacterium]
MAAFARSPRRKSPPMLGAWIIHETRVLASANIAVTRHERRRGLKDFPDASIPLVIPKCRWVHSFGMRFPVDVVYLDENDTIVAIRPLQRNRIGRPVLRAARVVETTPNAFRHWGLGPGDAIRIRDAEFPAAPESTPSR